MPPPIPSRWSATWSGPPTPPELGDLNRREKVLCLALGSEAAFVRLMAVGFSIANPVSLSARCFVRRDGSGNYSPRMVDTVVYSG